MCGSMWGQAGVQGVILDLRDNFGGAVASGYDVASSLLPEGRTFFVVTDRSGIEEDVPTRPGSQPVSMPLVHPLVCLAWPVLWVNMLAQSRRNEGHLHARFLSLALLDPATAQFGAATAEPSFGGMKGAVAVLINLYIPGCARMTPSQCAWGTCLRGLPT